MTACELRSTTVGWALHALEPEEERRVLDHLPHCAACRRTLRETFEVTTVLATAVPAVEPPAELRERVLAVAALPAHRGTAIRGVVRDPAETVESAGPAVAGPVEAAGTDRTAADADPVPPLAPIPPPGWLPGPRTRGEEGLADPFEPLASPSGDTDHPDDVGGRPAGDGPARGRAGSSRSTGPTGPRRWALVAVAAAVLGVAVLGGRALVATESPAPTDTVAAQAERIVGAAEARDPAGRYATLRGTDGTPVAVVLDESAPGSTAPPRVVPLALGPAGAGRTYVLWRVAGAAPVAVATFQPGGEVQPVPGPAAADGRVTAYAVSSEPAGSGVPARPTRLVADGTVV